MSGQSSTLIVCTDFNDVDSWLALKPLQELSRQRTLDCDWLPLMRGLEQLSNENRMTDTDDAFEKYKRRRQRIRSDYTRQNAVRYAALLGLSETDLSRQSDAHLVSAALIWMKACDTEVIISFMNAVFMAHFKEHKDLGDEALVLKLISESGIDPKGFHQYAKSEGADQLEAVQERLSDLGLFKSPSFMLMGERYIGREHLPLIDWYLSGQQGMPPV